MALAELMDIYPTACELVGVHIPESVQGKSLRPILSDPSASVREAAFTLEPRKEHFLRTADWAYMRYKDGSEELYDMKSDPGQFDNLAEEERWASKKAELSEAMDAKVQTAKQ
jgi:iduronate 2-sulfatase